MKSRTKAAVNKKNTPPKPRRKAAHSPGPWTVEFNNPLSPIPGHTVRVGKYPHRGICIVPKGGGTTGGPTQRANAILMAASPDLLAALNRLQIVANHANTIQHSGVSVGPGIWSDLYDACNVARALVAKVSGGAD